MHQRSRRVSPERKRERVKHLRALPQTRVHIGCDREESVRPQIPRHQLEMIAGPVRARLRRPRVHQVEHGEDREDHRISDRRLVVRPRKLLPPGFDLPRAIAQEPRRRHRAEGHDEQRRLRRQFKSEQREHRQMHRRRAQHERQRKSFRATQWNIQSRDHQRSRRVTCAHH